MIKRSPNKAVAAVALLVAFSHLVPAARAAETVVPISPPGSTDVDQAYLPGPGLYGVLVEIPYDKNDNVYDSKGHALPPTVNVKLKPMLTVPVALYVYPFTLFGGRLASSFAQPIERLENRIGTDYRSTQFGLADAYSDVIFWAKNLGLVGATPGQAPLPYGLNVGAGMALLIPDGQYKRNKPINLGSNVWVIDPNVAFTYTTGPNMSLGDSTQLSARMFYGISTQNPVTKYKTGNILDIDWSMTQQFGLLRVGVAGYYQTQTTNDRSNGGRVLEDGNRFSDAVVGPIIEYFIPKYNALLKAKYQYTFYARNFPNQQFLVLTVGIKL